MEFLMGLASGIVLCLSLKGPVKNLTTQTTTDKHVDALNTKAQKALTS